MHAEGRLTEQKALCSRKSAFSRDTSAFQGYHETRYTLTGKQPYASAEPIPATEAQGRISDSESEHIEQRE